jgi:hypothetical protein
MDTATHTISDPRECETIWDRYITMPVDPFSRITGIGRTKVYELLAAQDLESIVIGRRRLILLDSYRRLIEKQRSATPAARPAAHVPQPQRRSR